MHPIRGLLGAVLVLASPLAASAQVVLHGRVIEDASAHPVAGANILLQDGNGRVLSRQTTDSIGQFSFSVLGRGPIRLRAERMGYRSVTTAPLHFEGFSYFSLEIRLDISAVLLAPLEVVSRSRSNVAPTLAGFEERRLSGVGYFITREQIEKRNASFATDLLVMVPGVHLQPLPGSRRRAVFTSRSSRCPAQIFVDGFHVNRQAGAIPGGRGSASHAFTLDEMVQPGSIHGIEIYQGMSRVPAEFLSPEASCGVVAIWTRRGRG